MELKTTKNEYSETNNWLSISEDLKRVKAQSYDWWNYIVTDEVGNIYFNNSTYSISTSRHQFESLNILSRLGIKVNLILRHTAFNMSEHNIKEAINLEIRWYRKTILRLIEKIKTKGSWKKKNKERKNTIKEYLYTIKDLKNYRDNYVDKKRIPIKKPTKSVPNGYASYFLKKNGKVNYQSLNRVINIVNTVGYYRECPSDISKIKTLFGLSNSYDVSEILIYRFSQDVNDMIPDVDSKEYLQLKRWLTRRAITKENLNSLMLDKIHTYLVNKLNRKNYTPSEPNYFPVNEVLLSLEKTTKGLKVIKSDRELRSEGRNQSHCIGSQHYIDKCYRGYQALNYKGHTFLLDHDLNILECSGKYNNRVPYEIKQELRDLISNSNNLKLEAVKETEPLSLCS